MAKRNTKKAAVGHIAFLAGIVIAILTGILGGVINLAWTAAVLVLLGFVVGFMNISRKETLPFLVASIALILVGTAGITSMTSLLGALVSFNVGEYITAILTNFVAFVSPAALVVAIKAIWKIEER